MSKILLSILSLLITLGVSVRVTEAAIPFRDVSTTSPYYDAVETLYRQQIISDDGSGLFRPSDTMTRDTFVGLSVAVSCQKCITPTLDDIFTYRVSPFVDLSKSNPYYYCIAYASEKNIVQGYPPDTTGSTKCEDGRIWQSNPFCENNKTTRIEAAAMLLRQANLWNDTLNASVKKTRTITDVSDYWYGYANKAIDAGIMTLSPSNSVSPDDAMTRGEFALMAAKMLRYNQCMLVGSENTVIGDIKIIDATGKETRKSTFSKDEVFSLVGVTASGTSTYTYTWTARDSITGKTITGTGDTLPGSALGVGNWYIQVDIRDASTGKIVSTPTTTITISDTTTSSGTSSTTDKAPTVGGRTVASVELSADRLTTDMGSGITFETRARGVDPMRTVWDFGDGTRMTTSGSSIERHTYESPGIYTVTVTMTDGSGNTAQSRLIISVSGERDSDGDGVNDSTDACILVRGDAKNQGCPNLGTNVYTRTGDLGNPNTRATSSANGSLIGTLGKNTCIVNMAKSRGLLILEPVCDQCPCDKKIDFLSLARSCDVIFPTILSPDKNTLYSRGGLYQIP